MLAGGDSGGGSAEVQTALRDTTADPVPPAPTGPPAPYSLIAHTDCQVVTLAPGVLRCDPVAVLTRRGHCAPGCHLVHYVCVCACVCARASLHSHKRLHGLLHPLGVGRSAAIGFRESLQYQAGAVTKVLRRDDQTRSPLEEEWVAEFLCRQAPGGGGGCL